MDWPTFLFAVYMIMLVVNAMGRSPQFPGSHAFRLLDVMDSPRRKGANSILGTGNGLGSNNGFASETGNLDPSLIGSQNLLVDPRLSRESGLPRDLGSGFTGQDVAFTGDTFGNYVPPDTNGRIVDPLGLGQDIGPKHDGHFGFGGEIIKNNGPQDVNGQMIGSSIGHRRGSNKGDSRAFLRRIFGSQIQSSMEAKPQIETNVRGASNKGDNRALIMKTTVSKTQNSLRPEPISHANIRSGFNNGDSHLLLRSSGINRQMIEPSPLGQGGLRYDIAPTRDAGFGFAGEIIRKNGLQDVNGQTHGSSVGQRTGSNHDDSRSLLGRIFGSQIRSSMEAKTQIESKVKRAFHKGDKGDNRALLIKTTVSKTQNSLRPEPLTHANIGSGFDSSDSRVLLRSSGINGQIIEPSPLGQGGLRYDIAPTSDAGFGFTEKSIRNNGSQDVNGQTPVSSLGQRTGFKIDDSRSLLGRIFGSQIRSSMEAKPQTQTHVKRESNNVDNRALLMRTTVIEPLTHANARSGFNNGDSHLLLRSSGINGQMIEPSPLGQEGLRYDIGPTRDAGFGFAGEIIRKNGLQDVNGQTPGSSVGQRTGSNHDASRSLLGRIFGSQIRSSMEAKTQIESKVRRGSNKRDNRALLMKTTVSKTHNSLRPEPLTHANIRSGFNNGDSQVLLRSSGINGQIIEPSPLGQGGLRYDIAPTSDTAFGFPEKRIRNNGRQNVNGQTLGSSVGQRTGSKHGDSRALLGRIFGSQIQSSLEAKPQTQTNVKRAFHKGDNRALLMKTTVSKTQNSLRPEPLTYANIMSGFDSSDSLAFLRRSGIKGQMIEPSPLGQGGLRYDSAPTSDAGFGFTEESIRNNGPQDVNGQTPVSSASQRTGSKIDDSRSLLGRIFGSQIRSSMEAKSQTQTHVKRESNNVDNRALLMRTTVTEPLTHVNARSGSNNGGSRVLFRSSGINGQMTEPSPLRQGSLRYDIGPASDTAFGFSEKRIRNNGPQNVNGQTLGSSVGQQTASNHSDSRSLLGRIFGSQIRSSMEAKTQIESKVRRGSNKRDNRAKPQTQTNVKRAIHKGDNRALLMKTTVSKTQNSLRPEPLTHANVRSGSSNGDSRVLIRSSGINGQMIEPSTLGQGDLRYDIGHTSDGDFGFAREIIRSNGPGSSFDQGRGSNNGDIGALLKRTSQAYKLPDQPPQTRLFLRRFHNPWIGSINGVSSDAPTRITGSQTQTVSPRPINWMNEPNRIWNLFIPGGLIGDQGSTQRGTVVQGSSTLGPTLGPSMFLGQGAITAGLDQTSHRLGEVL